MASAQTRAYKLIYEASIHRNFPTPERPYVLVVYSGGFKTVFVHVNKTNGFMWPTQNRGIAVDCGAGGQYRSHYWRLYCGFTARCSFRKTLPTMIEWRDTLNNIHALSLGKYQLKEGEVTSIKSPVLRQKMIEAACLNAARA